MLRGRSDAPHAHSMPAKDRIALERNAAEYPADSDTADTYRDAAREAREIAAATDPAAGPDLAAITREE